MRRPLKSRGNGHAFEFFVFSNDDITAQIDRSYGSAGRLFSTGEGLKRPMVLTHAKGGDGHTITACSRGRGGFVSTTFQ